jgi:hypothetical protein
VLPHAAFKGHFHLGPCSGPWAPQPSASRSRLEPQLMTHLKLFRCVANPGHPRFVLTSHTSVLDHSRACHNKRRPPRPPTIAPPTHSTLCTSRRSSTIKRNIYLWRLLGADTVPQSASMRQKRQKRQKCSTTWLAVSPAATLNLNRRPILIALNFPSPQPGNAEHGKRYQAVSVSLQLTCILPRFCQKGIKETDHQ